MRPRLRPDEFPREPISKSRKYNENSNAGDVLSR